MLNFCCKFIFNLTTKPTFYRDVTDSAGGQAPNFFYRRNVPQYRVSADPHLARIVSDVDEDVLLVPVFPVCPENFVVSDHFGHQKRAVAVAGESRVYFEILPVRFYYFEVEVLVVGE